MRLILALAVLLTGTAGAQAYCQTVPDDASSQYVRNGARTTICMHDEISSSTEYKNFQTETRTQVDQLQREMLQLRMQPPVFRVDPLPRTFP